MPGLVKEIIAYKVLWRVSRNKLISACHNSALPAELRVRYRPGQLAKPRVEGTRLFIFLKPDPAFDFASALSDTEVWECVITEKPQLVQPGIPGYLYKFLRAHKMTFAAWKKFNNNYPASEYAPFHTVKSLTITKQIQKNKCQK